MEKMRAYGDRVQFSLLGGAGGPEYQVLNPLGKAMAFDRHHHLLRPGDETFAGSNASPVYTCDQIQSIVAGNRVETGSQSKRPRVVRAATGGTRASAARLAEQQAAERYAYFKENRAMLPATITQHTAEIDAHMKAGKPVAEAFDAVVRKYY